MSEQADRFASWASALGSAVAILGLVQSQPAVTIAGGAFAGLAVAAVLYARRSRRELRTASLSVEGLNLDSLNIANLRRRLNRSLTVQRAYHLATIEGTNLTLAWQYEGFCRSARETSMEFSIDTEHNLSFENLECFAFDLRQDPERLHKIRPILIGSDGISKKIAVPFLSPIVSEQPFGIFLNCVLPGSIGKGLHYYTSSLSFEQRRINSLAVHLVFARRSPKWMRVYELANGERLVLANELRPFKNDRETCEYVDVVENAPGQSARIYVYDLGANSGPKAIGPSTEFDRRQPH
jgi:hypothetical protein